MGRTIPPKKHSTPVWLMQGDCLERMKEIPDRSVDMVLTDPPYGTTACKWDSIIPLEPMWEQLKRLIKPNGAIVMTASQPFTTTLIASNMKMFKYCWVWNKKKAANFLFGNKMPLKITEDVVVFYSKQPTYNPIKRVNPRGPQKSGRKGIGNTIKDHLPNCPKRSKAGKSYEPDKLLPVSILEISKPPKPIHPTQKPVALMEYLIKTYTNEGETVLDFTMGSGTTGVACIRTGRRFIGIERDAGHFETARARLENELRQGLLPLTYN